MDTAFVLLNALLPLCWLAGFAVGRMDRDRRSRRGGYLKPPASAPMKARGRARRATATTARISSYLQPGDPWAGEGIRTRLAPPSRRTGLGSTGNVTVVGGADSGPVRRVHADWLRFSRRATFRDPAA